MQLEIHNFLPSKVIKKLIDKKEHFVIEPFLDPDWTRIWWKNIGINEYDEIKYFIFSHENEPVIIVPLVSRKVFILKVVEIAGGKVSDYLSPIFSKKYNFNKYDLIFIQNQILKYFNKHDLVVFRKQKNYSEKPNPFLKLSSPLLGLHQSHSLTLSEFINHKKIKKILNDNRRQLKKLKKIGKVTFLTANEFNNRMMILKNMIRQKEQRYKETNAPNMFKDKFYKEFYYDLIKFDFNFLKIHTSAIKLNENYLSTHIGFLDDKTYYYLMPSFDNKNFGNFSGGNILLENLIQYAQSIDSKIFDFTIGDENYKKKWTNQSTNLYEIIISNTIIGKLTKILIFIIYFLKRIKFIDKIYKYIYKLINR